MAKPRKPKYDAAPAPAVEAPDAAPLIGQVIDAVYRTATKSDGRIPEPGEWLIAPFARHAHMVDAYAAGSFNGDTGLSGNDLTQALFHFASEASGGNLTLVSRTLAVQAVTLDTIFTEYARRAAVNTGEYPEAMERYMRLALKAQAQSRATLETLAKLHLPREQTVRHIHVNQGGQAIVADQFHNHLQGAANAKIDGQPHGQGACGASLSGPDALGNGVPVPGIEGQTAL